jgi:hypothetical protein
VFEPHTDAFSRALDQFVRSEHNPPLDFVDKKMCEGDSGPAVLVLDPTKRAAHELARRGYTHNHSFVVLPSRDAPRWLLPIGDSNCTIVGAQIYAPYARTARLMKALLIRMIRLGWSGWARRRVLVASRDPLSIEVLVTEVTGERNPVFSLSLGNQPAVSKLTVQVMRPNGEVLGYLKLPLSCAATDRVRHEAAVLERLGSFPALRTHVPRLLYAGPWYDSWILFQSPLMGEKGPTTFTAMHSTFLQILWNVHRVEKPGQSLVEQIGAKWQKAAPLLDAKWKDLGREVLRCAALDLDRSTVTCGITHGDFAPWNTRTQGKKLLLFDWESADWESPTAWDIFHFLLQTEVYLKMEIGRDFPNDRMFRRGAPYLLYLLSSVTQFLHEENWTAIRHRHELLVREMQHTAAHAS